MGSSAKETIKQLKIKTGSVTRTMKDLKASAKEIASQQKRIQQYKDDPERDDHDVRKQEEVLGEYLDGRKYEMDKLPGFADALESFIGDIDASPELLADVQPTEDYSKAKETLADAREVIATPIA